MTLIGLTDRINKGVKLSAHQQVRNKVSDLFDWNPLIKEEELDELCKFMDSAVQAALQRGYDAGRYSMVQEYPDKHLFTWQVPSDAVMQAQLAKIVDPDTLSNLYSREKGFKP